MTDLGDRLDTLAAEATQGINLLPIDLAAHARRRHVRRVRAATAAAVCAVLAVAGISYWPNGGQRPVQVATAPGATAPPSAPAVFENNGIWDKLVGPVRQETDPLTNQPVSAVGVATTAGDARKALGATALSGNPSTPVYLVVATGQFACHSSCFDITGHISHGTVLGLVFDQSSLSVITMSLSTSPVDLSKLGTVHQLDMSPPPPPTEPAGPQCTTADSSAPRITTMPNPEPVTQTLALESNQQILSPPDATPKVTAAQAWATLTKTGVDMPAATGTVQLLLGDLYSAFPATIQNYVWPPTSSNPDTKAQPVYTHTLVWALYSQHQAVVPSGGGVLGTPATGQGKSSTTATTTPEPTCFFESTVSYVDATTGGALFSETFPPNQ